MVQLQKPKYVYMGGKLTSWEDAVLHVGCEAVTRGLNVFEGIKGYWQPDGRFGIVRLRHHYERLQRSARLLHIPFEQSYEEYEQAINDLMGKLLGPERDMWARTTLYVTEGHWGENTVADLVITAYHMDKQQPEPINLGVSTWQRSPDVSLPSRIKTSTNYQVARLARMEGSQRDCQDMILLNQWGRVAEATGACVLIVREGVIYTPPASEGALESITLDIVEQLAHSLKLQFVRRPIDRTELLVADEIAICGTLAEVTLVKSIDGLPLKNDFSVLGKIQDHYFQTVRGQYSHPYVKLSYVPVGQNT